jgi:hypothetical protein
VHRPHPRHDTTGRRITDVYHRIICRHQVEVEIWPPRAEVHFLDDWTANPADKQVRFEATIVNSDQGVLWEVHQPDGSPGIGTIDATGLYTPPNKGFTGSGATEIVVATAREDRLRKAFSWVTLVGVGPQAAAIPSIGIYPKNINLYYWSGASNQYMDVSNKLRQFRAILYDGTGTIDWFVNGAASGSGDWFVYQAPGTGGGAVVTVRAQLSGQPSVFDEASVVELNYSWP